MEATNTSTSNSEKPIGAGNFLNPEKISKEFGIKEGMSIADFGCGTGYFTIIIAQKLGKDGKVYALDIQESALDSVITMARSANLKNVETVRANLEILGGSRLQNNSQDMVMLHNMLFQSNKKEEIIREATRILKDNGQVVIIEWKKGISGLGPPDSLKTDEGIMKTLAEKEGLVFVRNIDAGNFHYGMILEKR